MVDSSFCQVSRKQTGAAQFLSRLTSLAPHNPQHSRAVGQLVLAALFWSLGGLLVKNVDWSPLAIAGGRGILAAAFLFFTNRNLRYRLSLLQWLAAFSYAGMTLCFVLATKLTTAANAILLQYTAPIWIALLGTWFLGERVSRADWVAIVAVLAGMALFVADGLKFSSLTGNLFGIASGCCFAMMTLLLRKEKKGSAVESLILGNLLAFAIGLPPLISAPALPAAGWISLFLLGTVQLGVSYWLYAKAIKHVTALEAVLVPVIEPLLNPFWVLLLTGEKPSGLALIGGAIVITAVTLRALHQLRSRSRLTPSA